jgi:carbamoyl-phosphate synthase large subunit
MTNVLLIPGGSGMAIAAIRALKEDPSIRIIAADAEPLAPGLYLAHQGYIIPRFDNPAFTASIQRIIAKEHIHVIIPALDPVLFHFAEKKEEYEKAGCTVIISPKETIAVNRDKWDTYNALKGKIPLPQSFITKESITIGFPLILKPRDGSGSINVFKAHNKEELDFYFPRTPKPIIQEYLPGKEYTIDCLADRDGKLLLSISRERIETKAGISTKGRIVKRQELDDMAKKIAQEMLFFGPWFFQAKEDKKGVPKLTEINPRIAGTMSLSSSSGANLHILAVRLALGENITIPQVRTGIFISRYLEDLYLDDDKIAQIPKA